MSAVAEKTVDINRRRKFIGLGIALGGLAVLGSAAGALGLFGSPVRNRLFVFRTRKNASVMDEDSIFYPRDEIVRKKIAESAGPDRA